MPFPPSVNSAYSNIPGRGRVSTKKLRDFKTLFRRWQLFNSRALRLATEKCNNRIIALNFEFVLPHDQIYTKAGAPKILDVSNHIKHIEDALCQALYTDDKWVWSVTGIKAGYDGETRHVNADIFSQTEVL